MSKRVFDDIMAGMNDALAYAEGRTEGSVTHNVPASIDPNVADIRKSLKLSRPKFAERFGLDVRAIRDWEQGRRKPDRSARILLRVIARHPSVVEEAAREAA